MQQDDDILLSAYLDGELPATDADQLTERLAREPALMARLEAMRSGDAAVRRAFAALDERPMPDAVLGLLGAEAASQESADVVAFPRRDAWRLAPLPVALAASIALVAGFLISNVLREPQGFGIELDNAGRVAANSGLHDWLESAASGEAGAVPGGATGELLFTFANDDGNWCRQLALSAGAETMHAVACRRDGRWHVEAMAYGPAPAAAGPFLPAGAGTPAAVATAVDGLIGPREPLDSATEKRLISNAWGTPEQ